MKKTFILLIICFVFGCATTQITAFKDPDFQGVTYKKIIVYPNIENLESRTKFEAIACEKLIKYDVECIQSLTIFLPTRSYTPEETKNILERAGIDAILSVRMTDAYTTDTYVPETHTTTGYMTGFGNTATYNSYTSTYGGYTVSKPTIKFEISITDEKSGKKAFIANSTTNGSGSASLNNLLSSLAKEIGAKLYQNGLIKEKVVVIPEAKQSNSEGKQFASE